MLEWHKMTEFDEHKRPWLAAYDREVLARLEYPPAPLFTFLERAAERFPEKTCTIYRESRTTYRETWRRAENLAASLVRLGVKKGDRVGLALVNSPSFVISFYGILRAGAVVVAINPFYKEAETTFLLNNAGVEVIIGQKENVDLIESIAPRTGLRVAIISDNHLDHRPEAGDKSGQIPKPGEVNTTQAGPLTVLPFLDLILHHAAGQELPVIDPDIDAAVYQYSGGTTGTPKAAIGLHRNLSANTRQFRAWLWNLEDGGETVLAAIPLYHVYGMVIALSVGTMLGAALLLEDDPRDLDRLLAEVETYRPGLFPCVPSLFSGILQKVRTSGKKYDLSSLRVCISGSAPLPAIVKEGFEQLTRGKILEGYGLSEAPTATHCNPLGGMNKTGSIGLPLPDVDCILAPLTENDLENPGDGARNGELWIRGPQVMAGYHNAHDADRDILAGGWLHTGDIASMDEDGYFYIHGRKKDLIKIGGLQVWPAEIEEVISAHPAVREVCVAGVPGPEMSEIIKAWIVLKEGAETSQEEIRAWVRERVASYKVPGQVQFRQNLPRTPVGKPLRRELVREHMEAGR